MWFLESNRKICGVYAITNEVDGGMYIGSSRNIGRRIKHHFEYCTGVQGTTGSYNLRNAVQKYGIENFSIKVLEVCGENELLEKEREWIDKLHPSYNVWLNPVSPAGSRDDSKLKPKELWKVWEGHKQSEETKRKISETMKGKAPSKSCIGKAAELHKKKVMLESIGSGIKIFDSLTECANYLGISIKHASLLKHDKTLFRKQFKIYDYVLLA